MAWSLLNMMAAEKVKALLDEYKNEYPPEEPRFYTREQAEAIIHAVLWGHASRSSSTAGCYAADNLFKALGLKWWTFDEEHAVHHQALAQKLLAEKHATW